MFKLLVLLAGFLQMARSNGLEEAADIDERIYRGQPAAQGQFPYQALLIMTNATGSRSFCGGSLIKTNYVLTAGHCCVDFVSIDVFLGMINIAQLNQSDSGVVKQTVTGAGIMPHENYNARTFADDICLLKLPTNVDTNANISTVNLPEQNTYPYQYTFNWATISGFGQTNNVEGIHPNLMYTRVYIQPHTVCWLEYIFINQVSNKQLCSGKFFRNTGPCHGDSGGPLVVKDSSGQITEIGLVSWGVLGCTDGLPVVYTYVPAYIRWINEHAL